MACSLADVAGHVEASSHTLYRIGSITKTFTTALVLSLRDEGKLDLEQPAEQYWPELAQVRYPFPDSARITLRHLLTHSSGLSRLGDFEYAKPDAQVTDAVLLGALAVAELDSVPGARYEYSNFGMSLVGYFAGRMSSEGSLRAAVAQRLTGRKVLQQRLSSQRSARDPDARTRARPRRALPLTVRDGGGRLPGAARTIRRCVQAYRPSAP
jgi:CubicO group peptidase (beta-lactamase class C family)